jgi:hypothetical protein
MKSPSFSSFRELMDKWDNSSNVFMENDLCLFFKKEESFYGATESGRITFARMKNPESKEDKEWQKEATFTAYDLEKTDEKNKSISIFSNKDIEKLKVLSKEEIEKELEKKGKKIPHIVEDEKEKTFGEK